MSVNVRKSGEFSGAMISSEVNTMFMDLYESAMGKAVTVSPSVQGVTLGPNAVLVSYEEVNFDDPFVTSASSLVSSTPKKAEKSKRTMRRPRKASTFFEIKSTDEVQTKMLMAELTKKQMLDSDKIVTELEAGAKAQERQMLDQLSRLYITSKSKKEAQTAIVEKALLEKVVATKEVVAEAEKDKIAESKAHERSEKIKHSVEEAKKKSAALQEKKKLYEIMSEWHTNYTAEYRKVLETIQGCLDPRALQQSIAPYLRSLRDDVAVTDSLRMKVKADELSPHDLKTADIVMKNLYTVLNAAKAAAKKIDDAILQEENAKKKAQEKELEDAAKAKAEAEKLQETNDSEAATLSDCFDAQSLQTYARLREYLSEVHQTLEPLLKDPSMNKFRFELQKAVTLPVNAISPVSAEHMMDKYRKLHGLLSGRRVEGSSGSVAPSDHPLGGLLVKEIMAKLFVRQGEMTVSSKPEAAFALASIIVNLWTDFPDFGDLLLAHFQRHCPYLAPVFLPQVEGQSDQDYYRSLGYLTNNGEVEKQDMFLKRMKGIMRLYAAILITKPRNPNKANPLGLQEAWRWLAAMLNLHPRPDTCAVLILELLDVVGHDLLAAYRGQAKKMLAYICKEYFPRLDKVTAASTRGPLTRLETFLEKAAKEGTIQPPAQRLSHKFW